MPLELGEDVQTFVGKIDDHDDVARALGLFVARWSLAEGSLVYPMMLASGCEWNVANGLLSSTNSAEGKIKLVKNACIQSEVIGDRKEAVLRALKSLEPLCEKRNEFFHHVWGTASVGKVVTFDYRKPPGKNLRVTERTAFNINGLANAAVTAAAAICQACGETWVNPSVCEALHLPTS